MLLIVPFKFCNLETAISGKKKRRRRVDDVGIRLYSARIGSIRVPAYGRGVGRTCANNLFLALEKQAIAGPVFQIRSRHFELQEVVDQLHLLLFVRVSSRHSSNGPDRRGQDNQSDQDKCHTAEPFCCPFESQFPQVSLFQTRESPERPEDARRRDQQANQVACAPRFQPREGTANIEENGQHPNEQKHQTGKLPDCFLLFFRGKSLTLSASLLPKLPARAARQQQSHTQQENVAGTPGSLDKTARQS